MALHEYPTVSAPNTTAVAEIQGLYGPFTISERLIQKIWQQQDFFKEAPLKTASGKTLHVIDPGRWNFQEGPDFREAQLKLDEALRIGDVELHFFAKDWFAHGHDHNPRFNNVILHGVLFDSVNEELTVRTATGGHPETLIILPFLQHDIEAYACREAILSLGNSTSLEVPTALQGLTPEVGRERLYEKAHLRWQQKCNHARKRLETIGWTESCHQLCLEALGYRRNRESMAALAIEFPLEAMIRRRLSAEDLFQRRRPHWKLAGLRPANHPRHRLNQYLKLLEKQPQWPTALKRIIDEAPTLSKLPTDTLQSSRIFRRQMNLDAWRTQLSDKVLADCIGGTREHTLICDALLPLAAATHGYDDHWFDWWFHWWGGDIPDNIRTALKAHRLNEFPNHPECNGRYQGMLQLLLEQTS